MKKSVEITCDACEKDFKIDSNSIRFRKSDELLFRYFVCPECNAVFLINVTDKEFRKQTNKGRMNAKQHAKIQEILYERYFPRFKELFPNAFKKEHRGSEATRASVPKDKPPVAATANAGAADNRG